MAKKSATDIVMKRRRCILLFGLPFTFTTYTITKNKLIYKTGFLNTNEDEVLLYRIVDQTKKRSLFQRIFGLGTIIVNSKDKTCPELEIKNIKDVNEFYETLSTSIERSRTQRNIRGTEIIDGHVGPDFDDDDFMN